ncbi:molybdopterin molybdotransferase MoeA, partial [uncultured Corynebacterium sp.]|uniref:molybdopterin molybdotransferase MoeA n=1 Tax=uncultured Corynebacterium sp. TaxID=159447 RepID=UPI0025F85F64
LTAAALAAAASTGHGSLPVYARPTVAVVATGAELVAPGQTPGPGQIPDSNAILITTLARDWGAEVTLVRATGDTADGLAEALSRAAEADVIITSGGISAGAFDPVKSLAAEGRADISFHKLRQQPGGPQARGRVGDAVLLGLPGNPVSVFVSALLYVRPLLMKLGGRDVVTHDHDDPRHPDATTVAGLETTTVTAETEFFPLPGRRRFVPAVITDGHARPVHEAGVGSHLIATLHRANALVVLPEGTPDAPVPDAYAPGTPLTAIPLDPALRRGKDRHS